MRGTVKWFDAAKGYGFINSEENVEVFVHFKAINADGYRSLNENDEVEFTLVNSDKGPQATNVTKL